MFGKRLATLRKQRNMSQYELAERLSFSRGQVANYEQGKREPDYGTLKKFADFFEVSTDYLLGRTNDPSFGVKEPSSTYQTDELYRMIKGIMNESDAVIFIQQFAQAPEEKRKQIRDFMRFILEKDE